ncbi:MAG: polysaccharide deacetylase family protein [Pseudomonadota bacterium]|nr:polysaccharide deacetylase family protein [Pseudomonadota bacterium]
MSQEDDAPGRWMPSPLLYASGAVHFGAAAAVLARPRAWPWALAALAVNHVALAAAGLWPRSQLLGPNWTRLPVGSTRGVAITIDDGPEPHVTPRVLAQLEEYRACATFFCVGERVLRYPDLAQEIIRCGHVIENHSQRHRHNFSLLGPGAMNAEISRAQESIHRVTGSLPKFFRAPAGLRNPFLDPVLVRLKLHLASWTRRGFDTVTPDPDIVLRRLTNPLQSGDILLLHDGHAARSRSGTPVILEVLPRLLDALNSAGLVPVTLRSALP